MALGDGVRRNIARLTHEERQRFVEALKGLNSRRFPGTRDDNGKGPPGGVTYWFKQDEIHQATHVHSFPPEFLGPAFLPWHRELCNRFEKLLQEVDPEISLHYWDWNEDPRRASDGQGGQLNLMVSDCMGAPRGQVGDPWLSAGFYDPKASPHRDSESVDNTAFDPPKSLTRYMQKGRPPLAPDTDAMIVGAEDFPAMRRLLEGAHDGVHTYVGGDIRNPHRSFRDPFVFLLHSNVDRLFALWQLQPGKEWRLDPATVYGSESDTQAIGRDPGILTPLAPWCGADAPGVEERVQPVRPWAPLENQQGYPDHPENLKNSRHPSVVAPPLYDTNLPAALRISKSVRLLFALHDADTRRGLRALAPGSSSVSLRSLMGV